MPPKPRFTKEEIIAAALNIVSENGLQALTAKSLGNALNASAIATLCATGMCDFTEEEISRMLTQDFTATMMLLKGKQ